MLEFTQVSIGGGGSCACTRCDAPVAPSFDAAEVVVARLAADPDVSFCGPDALLHPALPALIAGAVAAGAERIRLETDAAGLAVGGNAAGAIGAGVRHVQVTVLGDEETHDRLLGRPGAMAGTRSGLAAFLTAAAASGTSVMIWARVPVCRHNVRGLAEAAATAAGLGASVVVLDARTTEVDIAREAQWLTSACDTATVGGVCCVLEGVPFCLVPGYASHLGVVFEPIVALAKAPVCAVCPLDTWCPGFAAEAPAGVAAAVGHPSDASHLAARVAFARGEARDA